MSSHEYYDLVNESDQHSTEKCDICIVGAGAAGLYLATGLAAKGQDVILLEAGGRSGVRAAEFIKEDMLFDADPYPGATIGRYFGVGGTTTHWGGALVPHTRHDIRPTKEEFDPWSHIVEVVENKNKAVLKNLGWREGDDFTRFAHQHLKETSKIFGAAGLEVACNLMLPFRKKNFVSLLDRKWSKNGRLRIYYNATVNNFEFQSDGSAARLHQLEATSSNKKMILVTAPRFVLAAGTIETARILLEMDQSRSEPVIRYGAQTGRFLGDHLSLAVADVAEESRSDTINLFAPRFQKGWMRNFRFLEINSSTDAPRAFAHFIFDNSNPGFTLAKEVFGSIQERRLPKISASEGIAGIGGMARLGFQRYALSSLYIPTNTAIHLQLDIEQVATKQNGVSLGTDLDQFGRRVAKIHWRISEEDRENIQVTAKRFLEKWPEDRLSLPKLISRDLNCDSVKPHDAYHPVGTCRMGKNKESVVDENLKVWGMSNMWVVSTGVLPSAGTANPTFTMLCLAENLIEQFLTNKCGRK